jgi:hypothetical protein
MSELLELSAPERNVLLAALNGPLPDADAMVMGLCLRLCGLGLMQRAGGTAAANGWRGSPRAFLLTRAGWSLLKYECRRAPIRRAS